MGTPDTSTCRTPVLLGVCLGMLASGLFDEGGILVNHTLGMGGHSEAALKRFHDARFTGIDYGLQAIAFVSQRLVPFANRFAAVQTIYDHTDGVAARHSPSGRVDAILMDLGVSSFQLDEAERGFSCSMDAPLDIRMDPTSEISVAQFPASVPEKEIVWILRIYGEERFASRIARLIVGRRDMEPLSHIGQLTDTAHTTIPAPVRRSSGNPSRRAFQTLRIAVNDKLRILEDAIPATLRSLSTSGVLVVEPYQSLEDRIVKEISRVGSSIDLSPRLPMAPEHMASNLELPTRGTRMADDAEIIHNPRSISVRPHGVRLARERRELP